jgi:hypothetical protein
VLYRGAGSSSDPNELRYYLERAFLPTPAREIDFYAESDGNIPDGSWMTGLSVVTKRLDSEQLRLSSKAVENGWTLIVVGASIDECKQAFEIAGTETPDISEANVEGYAMLSDVDLEHPVFQPFNDVRLADFTKLPIWKHRNIEGDLPENAKVLASLDGRRPAIVELPHGNGRVLLFTFGCVVVKVCAADEFAGRRLRRDKRRTAASDRRRSFSDSHAGRFGNGRDDRHRSVGPGTWC